MSGQLGLPGIASNGSPPDVHERARIADELDRTLFVEAGAGAGKTSSLVRRIVNLVVLDGVPITGIAAITFTEKAAAELRSRVRSELAAHPGDRAADALERLDHAPIGTLHAFARRILFEFPVDAGLPPGFGVLDELESALAFEEQWDDLLDRLLDDPDPPDGMIEGGRAFVELCEFDGFGLRSGTRRVADDFRANWDLVADRVSLDDPGPLALDTTALRALGERIVATPVPDGDGQEKPIAQIRSILDAAGSTPDSLRARLELVVHADDRFGSWESRTSFPGNKAAWKRFAGADGLAALERLRSDEVEFGRLARELLTHARHHRRLLLGAVLGRFVLDASRQRAASGQLEFHDLLVLTRRLLATRPRIRRSLHERYQRVMLDEFQDTDPIQLEIAVRLSSAPEAGAQATDWRRLQPLPGRLFIVGEPKQSSYRFRRADIAQYLRAADQVGADRVTLSANFRSSRAVIEFTNDVFDRLIRFEADSQPDFQPLDASRKPGLLEHGTVSIIGSERHDDLAANQRIDDVGAADVLRMREAADVVATITTALDEGWPVADEDTGELRPARPGDVCVLLPTRISLPALEAELRRADVAYRAENASVVYATAEIRHLMLALRAADDPTDALALVAALRSPLYGCSDVELWEWKQADGSWNPWAAPPSGLEQHPVAEAIAHVRSVAERIAWTSPADMLAALADERRAFDLALDGPDARDVWRRLRYVIEQARAWSDAGGRGVRRYLQWARLQASEGRVADTILPEHDLDAVRVMTIHAAKGLEFPITIVAGLTTKPNHTATAGVVWTGDTWMLAGKGDDGVFVAHQPIDEQMGDAERRRLLYVACTRAVDHLVVSLHRGVPPKSNSDYQDHRKLTSAELLWAVGAAPESSVAQTLTPVMRSRVRSVVDPVQLEWSDPVTWADERERALARSSRRTGVAATRLAEELIATHQRDEIDDAGLDKRPVNVERPPWQRGRYGTSIGRAVHGVLQFCDLADGHDIDTLSRAQCAAEGVIGLEAQVAALARSATSAPIVRTVAAGAEHWRELFVAAPVGERTLEGYVDLLVRTAEGLVIVDYKTDQWSAGTQSSERIARYRLQLAAYGAALDAVLGEPVIGGLLVRCVPDHPAEQIVIADWAGAVSEVRRLVR